MKKTTTRKKFDDELVEIKAEIKHLRRDLKSKADLDRLAVLEKRVKILERNQILLKKTAKAKAKV